MTQPSPQSAVPSMEPTAFVPQARDGANDAVTGRFVWHDLMSTDPERALAFYQALLGWGAERMPISPETSYVMVGLGGQHFGGIAPLDAADGLPSHWIGYLAVDDVDAATDSAAELGGTACAPPTDIPQVGRFSVVTDPTGAVLSLFTYQPGQEMPAATMAAPIGTFCWDELMTTDPEGAMRFYEALVGWDRTTVDMGDFGTYWMGLRDGEPVAGLAELPGSTGQGGAQPYWLPYLRVADVDAAAVRIAELGGRVVMEPVDVPGTGRCAVAQDPTGALFGVFRLLEG